jgi:hypothetical protein
MAKVPHLIILRAVMPIQTAPNRGFLGIPTLHTSVNIWLFLTTLIESNAMKRLITLIASAVLMCPVWASAQTTPTLVDDMTWTGKLSLTGVLPLYAQAARAFGNCNTITNFTLQLQLPSNNSAIIPVNGYYTCDPNDNNGQVFLTPFSGTMLATLGYSQIATPTNPASMYILQLRLPGPATLECITTDSSLSLFCLANTLNTQVNPSNLATTTSWIGGISGTFTLVPNK